MPDIECDRRPIPAVAHGRAERSENPERFRICMAHTVSALARGEDVAATSWTTDDPVKVAAEIEVLAGMRRLHAACKESK